MNEKQEEEKEHEYEIKVAEFEAEMENKSIEDKHLLNIGKCYTSDYTDKSILFKILNYKDGKYKIRSFSNESDAIHILEMTPELFNQKGAIEIRDEYKILLKAHLKKTGLLRDAGVEE